MPTMLRVAATLALAVLGGCADPLIGTWRDSEPASVGETYTTEWTFGPDGTAVMRLILANSSVLSGCTNTQSETGITFTHTSTALVIDTSRAQATETRTGCVNAADNQAPTPMLLFAPSGTVEYRFVGDTLSLTCPMCAPGFPRRLQ